MEYQTVHSMTNEISWDLTLLLLFRNVSSLLSMESFSSIPIDLMVFTKHQIENKHSIQVSLLVLTIITLTNAESYILTNKYIMRSPGYSSNQGLFTLTYIISCFIFLFLE